MSKRIINVIDTTSLVLSNIHIGGEEPEEKGGTVEEFAATMGYIPTKKKHLWREKATGRLTSWKKIEDMYNQYKEKKMNENDGMDQDCEEMVNDEGEEVEEFSPNTTVIKEEKVKDVLRPLPDWSTMTLDEILHKVAYHRNLTVGGISGEKKVAIKKMAWVRKGAELVEEEVHIPVPTAGDGGEYVSWSAKDGEEAEDVYLKTALKARDLLVKWEEKGRNEEYPVYSVEKIDKYIDGLVTMAQDSAFHPFMDGEDVAEVMYNDLYLSDWEAKRQIRKEKVLRLQAVEAFTHLNWKKIQNSVDVFSAEILYAVEALEGQDKMDKMASLAVQSLRAWSKVGEDWVFDSSTPMGTFVQQFVRRYGERAKFNGQNVWKAEYVKTGILAMVWTKLLGDKPKEMNPAVKGTISRYVGNMLMVRVGMEILSDRQRREIGIDADIKWRTPFSEIKKGKDEYVWADRVDATKVEEIGYLGLTAREIAFGLLGEEVAVTLDGKKACIQFGNELRWVKK